MKAISFVSIAGLSSCCVIIKKRFWSAKSVIGGAYVELRFVLCISVSVKGLESGFISQVHANDL